MGRIGLYRALEQQKKLCRASAVPNPYQLSWDRKYSIVLDLKDTFFLHPAGSWVLGIVDFK